MTKALNKFIAKIKKNLVKPKAQNFFFTKTEDKFKSWINNVGIIFKKIILSVARLIALEGLYWKQQTNFAITACILGGLKAAWRSSSSSTSSGMSAEVSFTKRAAAELSRCFNGISVSRQNKKSSNINNSSQNQSSSTTSSSSKDVPTQNRPLIGETTLLLNKSGGKSVPVTIIKNSAANAKQVIPSPVGTPRRGSRTGQPPPQAPPKTWRARRKNYLLGVTRAKYLNELWSDAKFLAHFFKYFSSLDRCVLAQVNLRILILSFIKTLFFNASISIKLILMYTTISVCYTVNV